MPTLLEPVKRWIVCVTGFGQSEDRLTGVEMLQDVLRRQCSCEDTVCVLKSWRDNPSSLAQRIANRCPDAFDPEIVTIGYSWGGYSTVILARELQKRGLTVNHMLLCDAVWRAKFITGYPLSLTDLFTIHIPDNVKNLYTWRQSANTPRGSKIKLERQFEESTGEGTLWGVQEEYPHITHQHLDDLRSFRNKAREIACPHLTMESDSAV